MYRPKVCVVALALFAALRCGEQETFSAPIDPFTLGPQLHLRADQGVFSDAAGTIGAVNGGAVRHWADFGSANSDATNALNNIWLPTYQASGFGLHNRPAIRFDGFDDFLFEPLNLVPGAKTVFAVYQSDGVSGSDSIFGLKQNGAVDASLSGNSWTEALLIQSGGSYRPLTWKSDFGAVGASVGLNVANDTAGHVFGFAFDGINGANAASYDATYDSLTAAVVASDILGRNAGVGAIGRRIDGAGLAANSDLAFDGLIAELIVFNRELTAAEMAGVAKYLNEKYFVQPTTNALPEPVSLTIWNCGVVLLIAGGRRFRRSLGIAPKL